MACDAHVAIPPLHETYHPANTHMSCMPALISRAYESLTNVYMIIYETAMGCTAPFPRIVEGEVVEYAIVGGGESTTDILCDSTASKLNWSVDERQPFTCSPGDPRGPIGHLTMSRRVYFNS